MSDNVVFTKHAKKRMEERGITEEEVKTILATSYRVYPPRKYKSEYFGHFVNDGWLVVASLHPGKTVVITIYFNKKYTKEVLNEDWFKDNLDEGDSSEWEDYLGKTILS